MASIGHVAAGMAAARSQPAGPRPQRPRLLPIVLWSLLSLAPDLDVIGFSLGVPYEDEWGHRGATHSLVFSLIAAAAIAGVAPLLRQPALRTGITAALVLVSHALLDTLTDGGLGCALLWPFDRTRYFAPWTPIPVAPIGLGFLSLDGLMVAAVELVLFAPLVWLALRSPGRPSGWRLPTAWLAAWLAAVWFIVSGDPIQQRAIGLVVDDDTESVNGFSEAALRTIQLGESTATVRDRLGPPLSELWFYRSAWPDGCFAVTLKDGAVVSAKRPDACGTLGVQPATSRADAERRLTPPTEVCWLYTRSRTGGYYRAREVCFTEGKVADVIRQWHRD
jgi:inner membrane protein